MNNIRTKIATLVLLCIFGICCNSDQTEQPATIELLATNTAGEITTSDIKGAYIQLPNNRFDFGKIKRKKNPDVPIEVAFTNIGTAPLVILKADVSCRCISIEYPKAPILPGQTEKIKVNADLRTQEGIFNKTIYIKSNANNDIVLIRIVGEVKK